jgi:hypothetical protein
MSGCCRRTLLFYERSATPQHSAGCWGLLMPRQLLVCGRRCWENNTTDMTCALLWTDTSHNATFLQKRFSLDFSFIRGCAAS